MPRGFVRFSYACRLVFIALALAVAPYLQQVAQEMVTNNWSDFAISFGAIALAIFVSDKSDAFLVERSPFARRIFAGHDFVEGDWVDVVVNQRTKEVLFASFCKIDFAQGVLRRQGCNWLPTGEFVQSFCSTHSSFSNRILRMSYQTGLDQQGGGLCVGNSGRSRAPALTRVVVSNPQSDGSSTTAK